jgi:hypothetical protein
MSATCNNHEVGVQGPLLEFQQFLRAWRDIWKPEDMVRNMKGDGPTRSDMSGEVMKHWRGCYDVGASRSM